MMETGAMHVEKTVMIISREVIDRGIMHMDNCDDDELCGDQ